MPKMKIEDIRIGERQRNNLGNIEDLANSIEKIGLLHPIAVDKDTNELISGRRRIEAFKLLERGKIPVRKISVDDVLRAESDENVFRKDLLPSEAVDIGSKLEPRLRKKARERQKAMGRAHGNPSSESDEGGRTDQKIGKLVGMGKDRYRKAKFVVESAEEDERFAKYRDLMDEKENVEKYYREIKEIKNREAREKKARELPKPKALDRGELPLNEVICADALEVLDEFPESSIHFCMFSPGYWSLRDYGMKGQIGLEDDFHEYTKNLVKLCRKLKRVLREDGSMWIVIDDVYAPNDLENGNVPEKSMMMLPQRLALALIDDGWILRNSVRWIKQVVYEDGSSYGSSTPTGAKDRLNNNTETVYHFVLDRDYYYDLDSIRVPHTESGRKRAEYPMSKFGGNPSTPNAKLSKGKEQSDQTSIKLNPLGKNPGNCWKIEPANQTSKDFHATYPTKLVERPILATCPKFVCSRCGSPFVRKREWKDENQYENIGWRPTCGCNEGKKPGIVLDPLCGSASTLLKAKELGRSWIGIDINPDYVELARDRLEP